MTLKINLHQDAHSFTVSSSSRWRSQIDSLGRRRGRIINVKFFQKFLHNRDKDFAKNLIPLSGEHYSNYSLLHTLISCVWEGYPSGARLVEVLPQRQRPAKKNGIISFFSTNLYHIMRNTVNSHFLQFCICYAPVFCSSSVTSKSILMEILWSLIGRHRLVKTLCCFHCLSQQRLKKKTFCLISALYH